MRGFTREALLLFPKLESYEYRSEIYKLQMKRATKVICDYLVKQDIEPRCFATDEVGPGLVPDSCRLIQTLSVGDLFWAQKNCKDIYPVRDGVMYDDLYAKALTKFPMKPGLSVEQRFEDVLKREEFVCKALIKEYKLIVFFRQGNNPSYKLTSKPNDAKIIMFIDNSNFRAKCYMGGIEMDNLNILGFNSANRPVFEWEGF